MILLYWKMLISWRITSTQSYLLNHACTFLFKQRASSYMLNFVSSCHVQVVHRAALWQLTEAACFLMFLSHKSALTDFAVDTQLGTSDLLISVPTYLYLYGLACRLFCWNIILWCSVDYSNLKCVYWTFSSFAGEAFFSSLFLNNL